MSLLDEDLLSEEDAALATHTPNTTTHRVIDGIWYPTHAEYRLPKLPEDDDELWLWMQAVWGMRIPRHPTCEHHSTPFQAFADAYFARHPVAIWKASRGFGGKSRLLASLVLQEACFLPAQVTILGGSGAQSLIVHAHTVESWSMPHAPRHLMTDEPTKYDTRLANGAWIRSLMASQSSVRGPHPQRLRLDEIDEMELEILEASQGQPMRGRIGPQKGIETQTVMCLVGSTLVLTDRGEVPIDSVTTTDRVMTRKGWRQVTNVVMSGLKPVMDLHLSNGRTLTCTDDHRIATPDGWVLPRDISPGQEVVGIAPHLVVGQPRHDRAAQLGLIPPVLVPTPEPVAGAALTALPVGPGVLGCVRVPLGAVGLGGIHGAGGHAPQDVGAPVDRLQMAGVAAGPVPAQVIEVQPLGDLTDEAQVRPAVDRSPVDLPVHPAVPTGLGATPDPASGVGVDVAPAQEPVTVVGVSHTDTLVRPVYDLSVYEVPEFVAEGIVVHNSSTHQYPDKTMTAMLKRASENGWPIYEWCVGKGQHILTEAHGAVPIERLEPGTHRVLTRDGWRDLQHVTYMGDKPTVTLETTAGELICTADHKVATPDGWAEAGSLLPGALVVTASSGTLALPADPPAPVRDDEVGAAELMPLGTQRVPLPVGPRPAGVLTGGHRVQMPDVHARRVPAGVVEVQVVTDGADQFGPDPAVGVGRGATQVLDPVVTSHGVGPRDAVIGVDVEVDGLDGPLNPSEPIAARLAPDAAGVLQGHTTVVAVRDHGLVLPVYDIGVYGTHEFVIDGSEMVISNCWRESANPVDGWLTHDEVERKRKEIAAHMWETEYDLQEPSFEGRAIDSEAVNACFDPALGVTDAYEWESLTHQPPRHPRYVTGVDWAKQKDRTVIATFDARGDDEWECVAWQALTRTPWPHMVGQAERRLRKYPPVFGHDATGLGNVVSDFFDPTLVSRYKGNFRDVLMASGRARHDMFTEYVSAIESGKIRYPRIDLAYREHLYCSLDDLYGKGHPPDSVVAGAIAWSLRGTGRRVVAAPQSMGGRTSPWSI